MTNYITFPTLITYKLIEMGRSEDISQAQGLSMDELLMHLSMLRPGLNIDRPINVKPRVGGAGSPREN